MHTLVIVNPGHFHAGLVLRESHPEISQDVYIYAEKGTDLEKYMGLINSFNDRAENPTSWNFHVYEGSDFLAKAASEKKGDIAVFAGNNSAKISYIKTMHEAGFNILADKPLTVDSNGVDTLKALLSSDGPVIMDIMTEKFEVLSVIQKALMEDKDVFGEFRVEEGTPTIEKESVHHLYKEVNGAPLVRPSWYFDVNVQGEGIVDVTTHLAYLVQWVVASGQDLDFGRDVLMGDAKRWATEIPLEKYKLITKEDIFPESLAEQVDGDTLQYFCNGEFNYTIKGIPVKLNVVWALQAPEGGGDMHSSVIKGTLSDLIIEQGPQTKFVPQLYVKPHLLNNDYVDALLESIGTLPIPDIEISNNGHRYCIMVPASARTSHEEHFAKSLDEFLGYLKSGAPDDLKGHLICKYKTLAEARDIALSTAV